MIFYIHKLCFVQKLWKKLEFFLQTTSPSDLLSPACLHCPSDYKLVVPSQYKVDTVDVEFQLRICFINDDIAISFTQIHLHVNLPENVIHIQENVFFRLVT